MKDEFGGKVMTKFIGLKAKSYSHLIDDSSQDKKARITKKCAIKERIALRDFKYSKNFIKYSNDTDDIYKNIEE